MKSMGWMMVGAGVFLMLIGIAFVLSDRIPYLGRLPGDIRIQGRHTTVSFPVTTCVLLSIILTILLNVVLRVLRR